MRNKWLAKKAAQKGMQGAKGKGGDTKGGKAAAKGLKGERSYAA